MSGNLYQRGKIWWARYQIRGEEHRQSLRTVSKGEARKRLTKILEGAEHFRFYGENRHTWKEAVVEWGKDPGVKASVVTRYRVSFNQLRSILDSLYVDEIGRGIISQVARRPGVTNATRRRDLTAVSAVLRWCVGHNWIEENHARTWDRSVIRERREPITLPEAADIDFVVSLAPGNFAKLIRFAQITGMREEECASLERHQINEKRKAADLTRTKTSRPRSIPLDDKALGTYAGTPAYIGKPYVFWHDEGARYMNVASRFSQVTLRADKLAKKRAIPFRRFRFHDLRHWFAVEYLRAGGSIYQLQQILGHASIKTTEIYLDYLTPDEKAVTKTGTVAAVSRGGPSHQA